jgi:hypothetical protein
MQTDEAERQKLIYGILIAFEILLSLAAGLSVYTFIAIVFQSIGYAVTGGIFFSLLSMNLLNLVFLATLNPLEDTLYKNWISKRFSLKDLNDEKIASMKTNAEIDAYLYDVKSKIRSRSSIFKQRKASFIFTFLRNLFLVSILTLLGVIVANGLELFFFRNDINKAIHDLLLSESLTDSWTREHLLQQQDGKEFLLIESNSLLLNLNLLSRGLGNWKWMLDFTVVILFVLPYVLMYRSPEFLKGAYMRELVLHQMEVSGRHFILTRQKVMEIKAYFESDEFENHLYETLYGFRKP